MESSRNIIKKLKARQNRRKRSSVVMILKGDRERVRSLQKLIGDSTTSHSNNSGSSNSHELVIRSDLDNNNSDEERHKTMDYPKLFMILIVMFLGANIFEQTFPWMYLPQSDLLPDESMVNQHLELVIALAMFGITLGYICDLLVKDRKEKLVLSSRGMMLWYFFGLVSAIYLCICLIVQYANFHLHEDVRLINNTTNCIFVLCLLDCRQSCHSGTNELLFPYLIKKASSPDEWLFLLFKIFLAITSATWDQLSYTIVPRYAHFGMLYAIMSVFCSISELTNKGRKERVKLRRWGMLWWFYHPYPDHRPFGTLTDMYGLVAAVSLSAFSLWFSMLASFWILIILSDYAFCLICLACSTSHQTHRTNKVISTEWILLLINMGLEISSATFEQLSSRSK